MRLLHKPLLVVSLYDACILALYIYIYGDISEQLPKQHKPKKKQQELHGFEKRNFIYALSCSEAPLLKKLHIPRSHPPNILKIGILVFGSEAGKVAVPW